jgi:rubredoxin-NAD+ reductase
MTQPVVIAGSGLAGFGVARELRKLDRDVPIVLVTADDGNYYSKPMLSNALGARKTAVSLVISPRAAIAQQLGIEVRAHTRIEQIDRARREVLWRDGGTRYARLVLALGADPMVAAVGGDARDQVMNVNDLADYARFSARLEGARHVVIVGAGLVGCEFANDLVGAGIAVTVADVLDVPLARICPAACGEALRDALHSAGVRWRLGTGVRAVERRGAVLAVTFPDGSETECDLVLAAIGLRPRIALARAAGIVVGKGIATDRYLATSDPDVFAIGDCSETDGILRPFVMPIMAGARSLAATLTARPSRVEYPPMPIVVKTPACPLTLLPPDPAQVGDWSLAGQGRDRRAIFRDASGAVHGFALAGAATQERQALVREIQNAQAAVTT